MKKSQLLSLDIPKTCLKNVANAVITLLQIFSNKLKIKLLKVFKKLFSEAQDYSLDDPSEYTLKIYGCGGPYKDPYKIIQETHYCTLYSFSYREKELRLYSINIFNTIADYTFMICNKLQN